MLNVQIFLKVLHGDKEAEKEKEKKNKFEVDFLKKYNKKMTILKVIAIILFIVVLCTWALTIASLVKIERTYTKSKRIYEVLNEAYDKIEEVQNGRNYSLTWYYYYNSNNVYDVFKEFHKDNYFKEETPSYTNYGISTDIGNTYIQFHGNSYTNPYPATTFGGYENANELSIYMEDTISDYNSYDITVQDFKGIDYYVIKDSHDNFIWINKETMLLYKVVYSSTSEIIYEWSVGDVTDEDLKVEGLTDEEMEEMNKKVKDWFYSFFIPVYLGV